MTAGNVPNWMIWALPGSGQPGRTALRVGRELLSISQADDACWLITLLNNCDFLSRAYSCANL